MEKSENFILSWFLLLPLQHIIQDHELQSLFQYLNTIRLVHMMDKINSTTLLVAAQ